MKPFFLFSLLFLTTTEAQQPVTGKRVALVIGNNSYATSPLENCVSDAAAIAKVLREQLKFDTVLADKDSENLDRLNFTRRLQAFQKEAQNAAVALFYYAGHGMEDFDGRDNYLIPVDANLAEAGKDNAGLLAQGISLEQVLKSMRQSTQGAKIILLDCCRERPADRALRTRDGGGFVMPPDADLPQDTLIMLAAAPARTASDGTSGHGPFTAALLKHLPDPGTALFQTFRNVRNEVLNATNQQQKPWLKLDGAGDFFYDHMMVVGRATASATSAPPAPPAQTTPAPSSAQRSPFDSGSIGKKVDIFLPDDVKLILCFCPAGSFTMGSSAREYGSTVNEAQVKVTLTKPFWLARTELTQAQWIALMGSNPSKSKQGKSLPVESVSALDADACIQKLNQKCPQQGWRWSLPTEAQWEYACRAGSKTPYSFGTKVNGKDANYAGKHLYGTIANGPIRIIDPILMEVGSYPPNEWGLVDMHGNVWEWCADMWDKNSPLKGGTNPLSESGPYRVGRGGGWTNDPVDCRSAHRDGMWPDMNDWHIGFRPALIPESPN